MSAEYKVDAERPGEQSDIFLFKGEPLRLAIKNRTPETEIIFAVAPDSAGDPVIEIAFLSDFHTLSPSDLDPLPEGARHNYNIWSRQAGDLTLLMRGTILARQSIEPTGTPATPPPDPLILSGTAPASGQVGDAYAFAPTVSGGTAPYAFSIGAGSLPPGLSLSAATGAITGTLATAGSWPGITLRVTDVAEQTADLIFAVTISEAPTLSGTALIWRWGQSNEGTLGNSPASMDVADRGWFPTIKQIDSDGNTLGPTETYTLRDYAILDTGETANEGAITGPQGTYTYIGDNISVGPTAGLAVDIRDNGLFASADETWMWIGSSPGQAISYFMPPGEVPAYNSGDGNTSKGWQHKCYANRNLRARLAASSDPIYIQMTGDAQGEADTVQANLGSGATDDYITQYMTSHALVRQSDKDVLGLDPEHFKIQLLPVWYDGSASEDASVIAMNAAFETAARYTVDLSGNITDTGSGDAKLYLVKHDWDRQVTAELEDPHFTGAEQVQLGEAMAAALKNIHGGDGSTTAYELTEVKPQVVGVATSASSATITVTGYVSDPGDVYVALVASGAGAPTEAQIIAGTGGGIVAAGATVVSSTTAGAAFSVDVSGPAYGTNYDVHVVEQIASGEISVVRSATETTGSLLRSFDATLYTSNIAYTDGNLTATHNASGTHHPYAVPASSDGKRYFEVVIQGASGPAFVGVGENGAAAGGGVAGSDKAGWSGSNLIASGANIGMGGSVGPGDRVAVCWDGDAGLLWMRANDTGDWNNTGGADPASGSGGADISGLDRTIAVPMIGLGPDDACTIALDPGDWSYTAPSGFGPIG